jgi:site-specific DNA recombinase
MRLDGYIRVSDTRGRKGVSFISPEDQRQRIEAYCQAYSHSVAGVQTDLDESGGKMSRPGFDKIMERIRRGDTEGIIVARLDRFARSNVGAHQAAEEIEAAGGVLISVAEQVDGSTHTGNFVRSILFALAQMELERIRENWQTAKATSVRNGVHDAPNVPPGYVRGPDRILVPHPVNAPAVREVFHRAAAGANPHELAQILNRGGVGVVTARGDERSTVWHGYRIRRLLSNRVYLGQASAGEYVNAEAHEPLVTEEEWNAAQLVGGDRPRRSTGETAILSGVLRCASCRYSMRSQNGPSTPSYRCAATSSSGRCPRPVAISRSRVEQHVIDAFLDRYQETLIAEERDDELAGLAAEYQRADRAYREMLTSTRLRDQLGQADYERMLLAFREQRDDKRSQLQTERDATPLPLIPPPGGMTYDKLIADLRDQSRVDELRGLLASGIAAVFVRPAASRARNADISDRIRVVFHGDETLDIPSRGRRFTPHAYTW